MLLVCCLVLLGSAITLGVIVGTENRDKNGEFKPTDEQAIIGKLALTSLVLSCCMAICLCANIGRKKKEVGSERTQLLQPGNRRC